MLVRWHDMSAQKTGKNGPTLPVPIEEEEEPAAGGGAGADAASVGFGDEEVAATPAGQPRRGSLCRGAGGAADQPSEFSDAVAVQIPSQAPTDARKPYFLFGDAQNSGRSLVLRSGPARAAAVHRQGQRGASRPKDPKDVTGVASYDQGEWSVIFKRPLRSRSRAPPFSPGQFLPIAFSVWDGFSRERGNKRGLTVWYSLYVEPENVPSAVGPMVRTALFILALELVVIGWVRWRHGPCPRRTGGQPTQPAATSA